MKFFYFSNNVNLYIIYINVYIELNVLSNIENVKYWEKGDKNKIFLAIVGKFFFTSQGGYMEKCNFDIDIHKD